MDKLLLKKRITCLFILIFCVGVFLRLYNLGKQSLWLDEAYSVKMSKNLITLWSEQVTDSSPPLYYSILHYWMNLFGENQFSLRLLSCIFGILLIPLIFITGTIVFNAEVGIYAALLTAISPNHIYYSQEVRMYSLLSLLSLASFFFFYLSIKEKKNIYWVIYTFTTSICLYTHNYGIFLLFAEIFYYFFCIRQGRRGTLKKFMFSQICILFLYLPRLVILSRQINLNMDPWIKTPGLKDLGSTLLHFCLLSWRLPLTVPISAVLKIIIPVFILIFLMGIIKSKKESSFLLAYFFIPLAIAFAVSFKKSLYVPGRYDLLVFSAFCLIIAFGLFNFRNKLIRLSLLIIIIISTSISLYQYYSTYKKSNDMLVSNYVQTHFNKGDIIVATELSIIPLRYYWSKSFPPNAFQFPDGPGGFIEREFLESDEKYIYREIAKLMNKIYPLFHGKNRLWLLYSRYTFSDILLHRLNRDFKNTGIIEFMPGDNLNQINKIYIFEKH